MRTHLPLFLVVAVGAFISSFVFWACFYIVGIKVSYEFKWRYFKAILKQDTEWYDSQSLNELPTEFHINITEIESSTGRTAAFIIYSIFSLAAGVGVAFGVGAVFTVAIFVCFPYTLSIWGYHAYIVGKETVEDEKVFKKSGASAEQALNSIKVVKAFGRENYEIGVFSNHLEEKKKNNSSYPLQFGIAFGLVETLRYVCTWFFLFMGGIFITSEVSFWNSS
jgi:ATP-binding cassette, subfamily B (MDR/TAP), member 1